MPPKAKFTRDEIIAVALELVRKDGMKALTARELGDRLGSTARPIFTAFQNMEEVQIATMQAAKQEYIKYVSKCQDFMEMGLEYIQFAKEEPQLYRLIFMGENVENPLVFAEVNEVTSVLDRNLLLIQQAYDMTREQANIMYETLWIYTHGIATLCATGVMDFDRDTVRKMLYNTGEAMFFQIKDRGSNQ